MLHYCVECECFHSGNDYRGGKSPCEVKEKKEILITASKLGADLAKSLLR